MPDAVVVPNATLEKRVTQFTYQRNLVDDGGTYSYTLTEHLVSNGQATGKVVGTFSDTIETHESTDAVVCPGAAIAELGFEALVNPASGNDLSRVTEGDMVMLVERLCQVSAKMKGML